MHESGEWITPAPTDAGRRVPSFDGIPLRYTVTGSGEPVIVLVHGWSCSAEFWCEQGALLDTGRIVALDLAGHGRSTAAVTQRRWSIEAFARDVEAVVAATGAARVVLVGHSMGGAVALAAARRLGERCRFVLGVDTFTDAAFYARREAAEIARRLRAFADDFGGTVAEMVERITGPAADERLRGRIAAAMARTDRSVALAALEALLAWDLPAHWPRVRCPVATINSAWLARDGTPLDLPGLTVHELPRAGHFPMLEEPSAFNALARTILSSIDRTARS
jgi:pimeloyl-ACP methyl ester carboxylesterase